MVTIQNIAGRLVEVRVPANVSEDEMAGVAARIRTVTAGIGGRFVAVIDMRHGRLFSQPVVDAFIHIMTATNPLLERSALVVGDGSAVFNLQMERAIITARNPARRIFHDPRVLEAWLDEVLDATERQRLHQFLAEGATESA